MQALEHRSAQLGFFVKTGHPEMQSLLISVVVSEHLVHLSALPLHSTHFDEHCRQSVPER